MREKQENKCSPRQAKDDGALMSFFLLLAKCFPFMLQKAHTMSSVPGISNTFEHFKLTNTYIMHHDFQSMTIEASWVEVAVGNQK